VSILRCLAVGFSRRGSLGDFASGGGEPAECFDLTMETATVVLAGNHEQFVTGRVWEILDGGWARQARLAHAALGPARVETLRALPPHHVLPDLGVELVHGSLADPWSGFVHDAASAEATLARSSQPLVLAGHTHHAAHFRERSPGAVPQNVNIELGREQQIIRTAILNPGAPFLDTRARPPTSSAGPRPRLGRTLCSHARRLLLRTVTSLK
jgi:hypothetical protein